VRLFYIFFTIVVAVSLSSCKSTTCEPIIKYEKVYVDKYVGLRVEVPECGSVGEYPAFPADGTDEEKKEWAIKIAEMRDSERALDEGCIESMKTIIETINDHADVVDERNE
jgi:hypothetical protein